jgi:putative phosphoribosyl transferase
MTVTLPFRDRVAAGALLGEAVAGRLQSDAAAGDPAAGPGRVVVLGIPRGGVVVAAGVARIVGAPLDVVVAHKIGAPGNLEFALGAVTADGTTIVEPWARSATGLSDDEVAGLAAPEIDRARDRERRLRADRAAVAVRDRTAILVDDGIATGATVHAAILAVRALGAARVIVAAPVASHEAVGLLEPAADALVLLAVPARFRAVGEWYERFDQVEDEEVRRLLAAAG